MRQRLYLCPVINAHEVCLFPGACFCHICDANMYFAHTLVRALALIQAHVWYEQVRL